MDKMRKFRSKKEAFDFFQEQMSRAYEKIYEDKKLEYESHMLKSYLLEIDASDMEVEGRGEILRRLFSSRDGFIRTEVYEVEPDFFELKHFYKGLEIVTYVEWISDRFLFLYTLSKTEHIDKLIHRLVQTQPRIDQFWMWDAFLDAQIRKPNRLFRGFGFDYDYRKVAGEETERMLSYLKMQLWGGGEVLKNFYEDLRSMLKGMAVLGKVRFKEYGHNNGDFVISDVKFNGKIKSYGTDIGLHRRIMIDLKRDYEQKLIQLDRYRFRWSSENLLEGEPFYIVFDSPIPEDIMPLFLENIFSGKMPFRLMGMISHMDEYEYIAHVVDLHVGEKFLLQIFPDMMLLYLSEEVCTNTVLRFYTNLQHTLNVGVSLETESEEKII